MGALHGREPSPGGRHCWVTGLLDDPGTWPGILTAWERAEAGHWEALVVYAVDRAGRTVLVQAWVPAEHLTPAGG